MAGNISTDRQSRARSQDAESGLKISGAMADIQIGHPVLDELHRRAERHPIYLTCAPSVKPWLSDEIAELLRRRRPGATIVNSRGRYGGGGMDWRARWPKERERYGGMIVLTVPEPLIENEPETGLGIPGGHFLGQYGAEELADLVKLGRPVAWLACLTGGQRRLISRFRVEPAMWFAATRWARLFRSPDAESLAPVIGELLPFPTGLPGSRR